jgi:hypothetical protein
VHSESDQSAETAPEEQPVVLEDSEQDQQRMRELEERLAAQGGVEPDVPDTATRGGFGTPQTAIAEAKKHLGYRETGTNDTKFNRWLGKIGGYPHDGYGYPWCHAFVSYCLWHSDNAETGPRTAGCLSGVSWFKDRGRYSSTPHVGDLVYYGDGGGTHVELVVGVGPEAIQTIGGNTSGSVGGRAFFNGNGVYEKTVRRTSRIHGYGRPDYAGTTPSAATASGVPRRTAAATAATTADTKPRRPAVKPMTTVRGIRQQQEAVNALGYKPKLDVDGEWGPKTEAGVKWLQKTVGAGVDGEWGAETERLFLAKRGG